MNSNTYPFSAHWTHSAEPVLVSLIGGLQTFSGPLFGSLIFILLREVIERFTQNWMLWFGIILLVIIMGLTPPRSGRIRFKDADVLGFPPYRMADLGLAYMPDDLRIFPDLTCEENLEIARRLSRRDGHWNQVRVETLFPVLGARRRQKGLNLSGGEKKMLSLGRALMANPGVILMDEPSEGLAPIVVRTLTEAVGEIRSSGMTLLLADQNLKFCRRICDRATSWKRARSSTRGPWRRSGPTKRSSKNTWSYSQVLTAPSCQFIKRGLVDPASPKANLCRGWTSGNSPPRS